MRLYCVANASRHSSYIVCNFLLHKPNAGRYFYFSIENIPTAMLRQGWTYSQLDAIYFNLPIFYAVSMLFVIIYSCLWKSCKLTDKSRCGIYVKTHLKLKSFHSIVLQYHLFEFVWICMPSALAMALALHVSSISAQCHRLRDKSDSQCS